MIDKINGSVDDWMRIKEITNILGEKSALTISKLKEFDYELDVVFPKDYIHFLEVFGQGYLGESIRIHWPSRNASKTLIQLHIEVLESYKDSGSYSEEEVQPNLDLLRNSFAFGDTDVGDLIVWDLRTYNAQDDSYNIYWLGFTCDKSYQVGRTFYDFITKFCFGDQMFDTPFPS